MTRPLPLAVLACAAGLAVGCATATNYLDPAGPIFTGSSERRPVASTGIRVVTFNIKWAKHIDRAIALLSSPGRLARPDVLVLQEMDAPGTKRIAEALGLNWIYIPSAVHPVAHHDFGVAILSPWPLDEARKVPLPHQHRFRKLRRAAASATMQLPSGAVRVYSLHLESPVGLGGTDRRDQARAISNDARSWQGPVIVAGDFNGRGGAQEVSKAGFTWVSQRVTNTAGWFDFDHVLTRGLCLADERSAGSVPDVTHSSDHEPVWVLLRPCGA
jgi:endonuclease/exonuclease/phosphatase family metal-dependent hydrolase